MKIDLFSIAFDGNSCIGMCKVIYIKQKSTKKAIIAINTTITLSLFKIFIVEVKLRDYKI